jgi:uncharacterized protein (UPF0261 family)
MPGSIAIVGTLDTKGDEVGYLKQIVEQEGCSSIVVDVGTLHEPTFQADITGEDVAVAAGLSQAALREKADRRLSVQSMIDGASSIVKRLYEDGKLSGILAIGGGTGTHIGTGIMRNLPLGVPKLMLSTVASRDMHELIGTKDILMMHSVVDILGLNAISKKILSNAACAMIGMVRSTVRIQTEKPLVGLTSFGFITEGAMRVKRRLEASGYEVAPFHANGTGGMAMEDLIDQGLIRGVVDFALHEFADEMYGGFCGGIGPGRLEAAGRLGIPQIVVPGGLDCIVLEFDSLETMPAMVKGRPVFWYDFRSGVRTSREDVVRLSRLIAEKLNRARGPVKVMIPLHGWSEADAPGGPLYDPATNDVFVEELSGLLSDSIEIIALEAHINDSAFAAAVVKELDMLMKPAA